MKKQKSISGIIDQGTKCALIYSDGSEEIKDSFDVYSDLDTYYILNNYCEEYFGDDVLGVIASLSCGDNAVMNAIREMNKNEEIVKSITARALDILAEGYADEDD